MSGRLRTSTPAHILAPYSGRCIPGNAIRTVQFCHESCIVGHVDEVSASPPSTSALVTWRSCVLLIPGSARAGNLLMVLCVTMAAAVLSASFAVFLVREADSRSKHVQVKPAAAAPGGSPAGLKVQWPLHLHP